MVSTRRMVSLCSVLIFSTLTVCVSDPPTGPNRSDIDNRLKNEIVALAGNIRSEVERVRTKSFIRPVRVCVYTPREYAAKISGSMSYNPVQQKIYNDILVCQGLLHPGRDYFSSYNDMISTETGGFYVDGTDSLFVVLGSEATSVTGDDYITLFHEHVHALQDQYHNLAFLQEYSKTWNRRLGLMYTLEGEATLLDNNYAYKLFYRSYPSTPDSIQRWLKENATAVDSILDVMHQSGQPLVVRQPMYWAYYSYGPQFIDAVVKTYWPDIDTKIFPRLPFGAGVVLHPERNFEERQINCGGVNDYINATQRIVDVDEFGEVITNVLFREWDFSSYKSVADGLWADNAVVYTDLATDTLRFIWYTLWNGTADRDEFWDNYVPLVNKKWNITLPAPVVRGDTTIINDAISGVYLEKSGSSVFAIERYIPRELDSLVERLRAVTWTKRPTLAKAADGTLPYPCIDKRALAPLFSQDGFIPVR